MMPRGGSNRSGGSILDGMKDLLRDTLTVEAQGQPSVDPNTGVPSGTGTVRLLLTQKGSLQPVRFRQRGNGQITDGVAGSIPSFIFYTAPFTLPTLASNETLVWRVNSTYRSLIRQGGPLDVGGQAGLIELEFSAEESGR